MLSEYESEKLAAIKSHLSCPLCHQIFLSPCFLSGCGHTFCGACLKQRFSWRNECPQCKVSARPSDLTSSLALNAIVSAYLRFDARAASLQFPLPIVENASEIMDEGGINYSSTSVIEIHEDSDDEGTCTVELEDPDQAKAPLAALTIDVIKEDEDSDEDESIWTRTKLPVLRESNGSKAFSELIHRKKKLKTFSNGDIRIFAVDSQALTSSSLSVKKPQSNHRATATAYESCSVVTIGTAVDKNDGVITTKEQCPGPFYSHNTEAINLTQDTLLECYEKSRNSASFIQTIVVHNKTDTQILEGVGLVNKKERSPPVRAQKKDNFVHIASERKIESDKNTNPAEKIVPVKDIFMRKDQNMDKPSPGNQHLSDHQNNLSTSSRVCMSECSAEEAEKIPKAVKNILPHDHQYYPVSITGSTGSTVSNNNSDVSMSLKKQYISHEGSEVSLVISLDDNCQNENTDYFDSNYENKGNEINVIKNHGSNIEKINGNKLENEYENENKSGNINDNCHSTIRGSPNDIVKSKINYACVDDDCNDDNDDDNGNEIDKYKKLCVNAEDKGSNEFYCKNDDNNHSNSSSNSFVDNDGTDARNDDNNPIQRLDHAPPNSAGASAGACIGAPSKHPSHTNSPSMLLARSNDNCNSNSSSNGSSSSSSSSDVQGYRGRGRDSYHSPNTTTTITINSNSTPSSTSSSSSRYSSSSGPHHPNASALIPDPDPRSGLLPSEHGRPIDSSYTNLNPKNESNNFDGVQDSQFNYTTDDSYNDDCHTKNWTQNPDSSANGENSCADLVEKIYAMVPLLERMQAEKRKLFDYGE